MTSPLRFGIWALVHGNRAAMNDPFEPYDASWERNARLVREAETLGYDSVLVAQHTVNPHDRTRDQLEAWTASAALAAITSRIEIIAATKPLLHHPVVLAKMALQIEHIARGRFALNVVNAWNRAEFEPAGMAFPEHDARYAYGSEWLEVVSRLIAGEAVTFRGEHFRLDDYQLRPADPWRTRPALYVGGESEPARDLVARQADVWFINGQPLENVRLLIADVAARPRASEPLRFGLSAFVIARPTRQEAEAEHARLAELAAQDAGIKAVQHANTDPKVVMIRTMASRPSVGTNGGTAAGLVGSYDEVAERIAAFHAAGIELFMLQFQPFEAEMRRFAAEVAPRARAIVGTDSQPQESGKGASSHREGHKWPRVRDHVPQPISAPCASATRASPIAPRVGTRGATPGALRGDIPTAACRALLEIEAEYASGERPFQSPFQCRNWNGGEGVRPRRLWGGSVGRTNEALWTPSPRAARTKSNRCVSLRSRLRLAIHSSLITEVLQSCLSGSSGAAPWQS